MFRLCTLVCRVGVTIADGGDATADHSEMHGDGNVRDVAGEFGMESNDEMLNRKFSDADDDEQDVELEDEADAHAGADADMNGLRDEGKRNGKLKIFF